MATPIPQNQASFTLEEIMSATGGVVVARGAAGSFTGVTTDSRAVTSGSIFVALRGDRVDGHAHVAAAAEAGAALVIVESEVAASDATVVRVGSTLDALGAIARSHARRWRAHGAAKKVVAITGSAGKTTTRVAISALAEAVFPGAVLSTRGNLNNRIGLPMTLLTLEDRHDLAVVELGMNTPGEIERLAAICEPDVGVVTLVAAAHTELLGSIEGVAQEKGALFRALGDGGIAIANADDARVLAQQARTPATRRLTYGGRADADVRIDARRNIGVTRSQIGVEVRRGDARDQLVIETPLLGDAGALACAAAIAVVDLALGHPLTGQAATAAFARADVGAGAGRLVPRVYANGLTVIDDSYNANPASMASSIGFALELGHRALRVHRVVLVLGEMLELGADADEAHASVGRTAALADVVVGVAGRARLIAEAARAAGKQAHFCETTQGAIDVVTQLVAPGDVVLVKGSRGVATEAVARALDAIHASPAAKDA